MKGLCLGVLYNSIQYISDSIAPCQANVIFIGNIDFVSMSNLLKALYCFFLLIMVSPSFAQSKQSVAIDSLLRRANRLELFNGNVLIADQNKIIYKAAIGFADADHKNMLTDQYRFQIGSIAKEFNAVGIMMLKEQGKLSLDDKVSKFFPELPAWANEVKVIHLLQYTSGIPDVKWKTVKNDADNMADLMKLTQLNFVPGTNYAYNNNNVFLQRRIIEKVTGITFRQFVEQKILKPAKITHGIIDPANTDPLIAMGYNNANKQDDLIYPITGWTCLTVDDFYKWSQCINKFTLISPASTRQILLADAPNRQSGLGKGSMDGDKLITHIHDGTTMNYQALLASDIPKGRTILLMTNNKQNNLYDINAALTAILEGKPYQQFKKPVLRGFETQPDQMTGEQVLAYYQEMKSKEPLNYNFENESALNEIGYLLLGKNKTDDAITVFEYNTRLFPNSGNVFDSLGEAYYKQGNKAKALLNYKQALRLDPTNKQAKAVVTELEK